MTHLPVVANLVDPAPDCDMVVKTTVTSIASKSLRAAARRLPLLAGALLSWSVQAQSDIELADLIFDVAPIPQQPVPAPGGVGGGTGGNGTGANTGPGTGPVLVPDTTDSDDTNLNLDADIRAYRERIRDTQANDNPYSNALREQFDALGALLQQDDEHEDAIAAFESAMHIDRVNGGLYTLDQIPLVEKIIASHEALGNYTEVHDFHAYLFYIKQKSFDEGDPRLLAAQEEWADWNVESWLKEEALDDPTVSFTTSAELTEQSDYVAVQNRDGSFSYVPRMQLLSMLSTGSTISDFQMASGAYAVQPDMIVDERLRTARDYYEDIIEAQSADDSAAAEGSPVTGDHRVEHKLANVAYAMKEQIDGMEIVNEPSSMTFERGLVPRTPPLVIARGYTKNRDVLESIAQELEEDPNATVVEKAQAWIDLGDWHVGFDYPSRGENAYQKAWQLLSGAGMDQAAIDAVFMPKLLVPAPGFAIHDYSRELHGIAPDAELVYKGYMDLTLDVTRYGDVRSINVDAETEGTSEEVRDRLLDYLRAQKVRPAFENGESIKRESVKLRYNYSY